MLFKAAGKVNHWNDREQATDLDFAPRGPAFDMLRQLHVDDYKKLTATLELYFGEQHIQQLIHTHLRNRKKKVGETERFRNRHNKT